ncbi:MAG: hypothetical protein ACE5LB_10930, partial [Acidiferrobacterales bacterium]
IGLIQIGQTKQGVTALEKIARMRAKTSEMHALRDKANLALGFAFLGVPNPQRAKSYFREVRLNGPFSSRALLGLGWALSANGKHKQSLVPWIELQQRQDIDVAVQESLLAVPYALGELAAYKQALQQYENAISVYNTEIERLAQTVESLRGGKRLAGLIPQDDLAETAWVSAEESLPDTPENRYLIQLFSSHAFHEAVKNYNDLRALSRNLDCWSAVLESDAEQDLVDRLETIDQRIAAKANRDASDDQKDCGRLNSASHWEINAGYAPSLWQNSEEKNQLDPAAARARSRPSTAQPGQAATAEGDEAWKEQIVKLRQRVAELKAAVDHAERAYERNLLARAALELERQKKRLRAYVTQARFGIAQLYDRSSRRTEKRR